MYYRLKEFYIVRVDTIINIGTDTVIENKYYRESTK
jgi:hypothetical protein